MTHQVIGRLTAADTVALAVMVVVPSPRTVRGAPFTWAQSQSKAGQTDYPRLSNGKIAYISGHVLRDPIRDLLVINPDGTGQRTLVHCRIRECVIPEFAWSPNGSRLAFMTTSGVRAFNETFDLPLYVIDADGSRKRLLVGCGHTLSCNIDPAYGLAWSPDGSRLVFSRRGPSGFGALYIVDADTGRHRLLTQCTPQQLKATPVCIDAMPAWSPDGTKIVFAGNDGPLYVVNADGSEPKPITPTRQGATFPEWSPDGKTIAFSAGDGMYSVHADGSHLKRLVSSKTLGVTFGPGGSWGINCIPAWSPDGARILFVTFPEFGHQSEGGPRVAGTTIWVMDANGAHLRRLYRAPSTTIQWGGPVWSPDGKYISFSLRSGKPGIYVMDREGRHPHRLARTYMSGDMLPIFSPPAWQPLP